jgi:hypothetical protein
VSRGTTWSVTVTPAPSRVELYADGKRIADLAQAPFAASLDLSAGSHKLGVAVTVAGVRTMLGTNGVLATITIANGKKKTSASAAATGTQSVIPSIRWDSRRFTTAAALRKHLTSNGLGWDAFLRKHPAVVKALGLYSVEWGGRTFFSWDALSRDLAKGGVRYAEWVANHRNAAARLHDNARARITAPRRLR